MFCMKQLLLTVSMYITFFVSFAQTCPLSSKAEVSIDGKGQIIATLNDQRQAILKQKISKGDLQFNFRLLSNTCKKAPAVNCRISYGYAIGATKWFWLDKDFSEKPVKKYYCSSSGKQDFEEMKDIDIFVPYTSVSLNKSNKLVSEEPSLKIICDNYDWLPKKSGNQSIKYIDVDFEREIEEAAFYGKTKSVNKFSSRIVNIPYVLKNGLHLLPAQDILSDNNSDDFLFIGYKAVFTFDSPNMINKDDSECTATFEIDFAKVFAMLIKIITGDVSIEDKKNSFLPLVKDSDSYNLINGIRALKLQRGSYRQSLEDVWQSENVYQ